MFRSFAVCAVLFAVAMFLATPAVAGGGCRSFVSSSACFAPSAVVVQSAPCVSASSFFVQSQVVAAHPQVVVRSAPSRVFVNSGGGVAVSGFGASAVGNRRAVIRSGGLRGLLFGDVIRAR